MTDFFIKLFQQLNSSVFTLIIILLLVMLVIYKIGTFVEKFKHHENQINKATSLFTEVIRLSTKVDLIYQNTNPNRLMASHSPISLTPLGEEVIEKIEGNKILSNHLQELRDFIKNENPKNA